MFILHRLGIYTIKYGKLFKNIKFNMEIDSMMNTQLNNLIIVSKETSQYDCYEMEKLFIKINSPNKNSITICNELKEDLSYPNPIENTTLTIKFSTNSYIVIDNDKILMIYLQLGKKHYYVKQLTYLMYTITLFNSDALNNGLNPFYLHVYVSKNIFIKNFNINVKQIIKNVKLQTNDRVQLNILNKRIKFHYV